MGSPNGDRDRYWSTYDWAGLTIRYEVTRRWPNGATICDIGAGYGKWADLLPGCVLDAVEVWRPTVEAERLADRYRRVYAVDVRRFRWSEPYDAAIFGDVLEHLDPPDAHAVLRQALRACDEVYVAVPYEYPQGEVDGNPHEEHRQDDLTPESMWLAYPELRLLDTDGAKGVYVRRSPHRRRIR